MRRAFPVTVRYSLLPLVLIAGCDEPSSSSCEVAKEIPTAMNRRIDILFVVDESPAMAEFQELLAINAPRFIDVLETIEGGLPYLHLGVISADIARDGMLVAPFLAYDEAYDGTVEQSWTGTLKENFVPQAMLGAGGDETGRPLEAMQRALDGRNAGFLRDDAYLLVVILSPRDDASPADVLVYADALKALESDPRKVMVSIVAPDAEDALRLHAFADQFPDRNIRRSIDAADWSTALELLAGLPSPVLDVTCLDGDIQPEPLECVVTAELTDGTQRTVESCDDPDATPCWSVEEDPATCPDTATSLVLRLEPDSHIPDVELVTIRCATVCD